MKKILSLILVVFATIAFAKEFNVLGNFSKVDKNGMPNGWYLNKWVGYQPAPTLVVDAKDKTLHVSNITGRAGFGITSNRKFYAVLGDECTVKAKIKGKGKIFFGLQTFNIKGKWINVQPNTKILLSNDWQDIELKLKISKKGKEEIAKSTLAFGATKNSDIYIKDLKFYIPEKK